MTDNMYCQNWHVCQVFNIKVIEYHEQHEEHKSFLCFCMINKTSKLYDQKKMFWLWSKKTYLKELFNTFIWQDMFVFETWSDLNHENCSHICKIWHDIYHEVFYEICHSNYKSHFEFDFKTHYDFMTADDSNQF